MLLINHSVIAKIRSGRRTFLPSLWISETEGKKLSPFFADIRIERKDAFFLLYGHQENTERWFFLLCKHFLQRGWEEVFPLCVGIRNRRKEAFFLLFRHQMRTEQRFPTDIRSGRKETFFFLCGHEK